MVNAAVWALQSAVTQFSQRPQQERVRCSSLIIPDAHYYFEADKRAL